MRQRAQTLVLTICMLLALSGCCSLYRPDLMQGDHITQKDLDKLQPGMAKIQVSHILGTPALEPVLEVENWHYTFAYRDGTHRDKPLCFETITLYFKNDLLQSYSSNYWRTENLPQR